MDSSIGDLVLKISKIMSSIADRVSKLEEISHKPREFVSCGVCKQKIREKKDGKKK